jgi:hypothetical protein
VGSAASTATGTAANRTGKIRIIEIPLPLSSAKTYAAPQGIRVECASISNHARDTATPDGDDITADTRNFERLVVRVDPCSSSAWACRRRS